MKTILLLGAGKSSGTLIQYLLNNSISDDFILKVGDLSLSAAQSKVNNHPNAIAFEFSIDNIEQRESEIQNADLVISLLPPALHILAARDCVRYKKNLVTASYVSDEINSLHKDAIAADILLLNECGLDPGIDHMSAMQIIHRLQADGATITGFRSYCGGLVAHESIDNPWGYKFSWNPRNVILAGQGTAKYLEDGRLKFKPYHRLFAEPDTCRFSNNALYDAYPNRDSISYREVYGIENIKTMIRGTLRHQGYCRAWNIFVQLGLTDESYTFPLTQGMTYAEFFDAFLPGNGRDFTSRIHQLMGSQYEKVAIDRVIWTGIASDEIIPLQGNHSPAFILQELLERKWKLQPEDKDLVVMQHLFDYELNGQQMQLSSSLHIEGENSQRTAMGKTVGIPLAIAVKNLINGTIKQKGLLLPVIPEIYEPILEELENEFGIRFIEEEISL
jgi:saccharopine dehydrogenase (NADP+, L-glutamate forming)